MGTVTYLTRISGYLLFKNRDYPRLKSVFEIVPGCVLISLIAPSFVTGRPADLITLILTVLTAIRCSFLVTLVVAVGSAGLLRAILS